MSNNALEKTVIPIDLKGAETMIVRPEGFQILNKTFSDVADFEAAYEKGGLLSGKQSISFSDVKAIRYEHGGSAIKLDYVGMGLTKPGEIGISSVETQNQLFDYLEKKAGFRRSEQQVGSFKAILSNLFYVGLAAVMTWGAYSTAVETESGLVHGEVTGRRRGLKRLFMTISDTLGSTGCLLVGGAITAFLGYLLFKKFQNPPTETRFER